MKKTSRRRGRPTSFDRIKVLDNAVLAFWCKGYEGTSLDDLTRTMGINRPSLYAAFSCKKTLFLEAIERYAATYGCQPMAAMSPHEDIVDACAAFLEASIDCVTASDRPRGCLIATVAVESAAQDEEIRQKLAAILSRSEKAMTERFRRAIEEKQLPPQTDPAACAGIVLAMTHSFAVRARIGEEPSQLRQSADGLLKILFPASGREK